MQDVSTVCHAIELKFHSSWDYYIELLQFAFLIWPSDKVQKRKEKEQLNDANKLPMGMQVSGFLTIGILHVKFLENCAFAQYALH